MVYYWDGSTASSANNQSNNTNTAAQNWVSGGNWDNGTTSATRLATAFTATDDVVFGGTAASQTITASALTIRNMTFGGGTDATGTTGTAYTISGTVTIALSSGTITTNTPTTISSILGGGTSALTKAGNEQLTLTGANTYSGATTVSAGTLRLGDGTTQPTINSTYSISAPATLRIQYNTATGAVAQTWTKYTGAGTLALATGKNNDSGWGATGGIITLGNTFTGTLRIEGGRVYSVASTGAATNFGLGGATKVVVGTGGHFGMWESITIAAATAFEIQGTGYGETGYEAAIRMANGSITSTINGSVTLTGNATVAAIGTGVIAGVISETGGPRVLTLGTSSMPGLMSLTGANTYTGNTTLAFGSMNISGTGSLGSGTYAGAIALNSTTGGGTFTYNSSTNQTLNGTISGAGALTMSGASTLILGGSNNYSGTTTISSGTLALANGSAISNTGTINLANTATATLRIDSDETIGSLAGGGAIGGTVNLQDKTLSVGGTSSSSSFAGVISGTTGGITKVGSGTFTLTGANTYAGTTIITNGTVVLSSTGTAPNTDITVAGLSTLQVDSTGKTLKSITVLDTGILSVPVVAGQTTNLTGNLDLSNVTGSMSLRPVFPGGSPIAGTYDLVTAVGSVVPASGAITLSAPTWAARTLAGSSVSVVGGNKLQLTVGGLAASLVWDNVGGAGTGIWSAATPADNNFKNGVVDDVFYNADSVTFGDTAAGTVTLVGALSPSTATVSSTSNYIFTGAGSIAGSAALVKSGSGTLTINTANTYTGLTTINAGVLEAGTATAFGPATNASLLFGSGSTGTVRLNGNNISLIGLNTTGLSTTPIVENGAVGNSVLTVANTTASTFVGVLRDGSTGTLGLTKSGTGTLSLLGSASITYTGLTTVDNGTLELGKTSGVAINGPLTMGVVNTNQPNLRMFAANQFASGLVIDFNNASGNWTRFDLRGFSQTLAGINTGTASLAGSGIVQNREISNTTSSYGTATLTLNSTGTYLFNGYIRDSDNGVSATNMVSIFKDGIGSQTIIGANVAYTGGTTVNNGTLILQDTTAFTSPTTVASGGTLQLNRSVATLASRNKVAGLISGTGTVNINNTTSGIAGGWVTFNGVASGLSNFFGTLNVNSGVLSMDNTTGAWTNSAPTVNVAAGGLFGVRAQSNVTMASLNGAGDVGNFHNSSQTLTVGSANGSGSFSGILHGNNTTSGTDGTIECGTLNLTKVGTGTQVLSGLNTYTGSTTISGGILALAGGNAIVDTNSITLDNTALVTLRLDANEAIGSINGGGATGGNVNLQGNTLTLGGNNASSTFAGAISGTLGAITKQGTGVLTLSGASTYTGATTISAGSLVLSGTGTSNISLVAGSAANITGSTTGSLTAPDSTVVLGEGTVGDMTLGSATGATINVNPATAGALTAGGLTVIGTTIVNLTNSSFTPGVPFTVINFTSNNGFEEANFAIANPANYRPAIFDASSGTSVTLTMSSLNLTWNNSDTSNAGKWDFNSATNFYNAAASGNSAAVWGDFLTFNDAAAPDGPAAGSQVISVIGAQQPAGMTVTGAYDYTFNAGASGSINGGTSLAKSGSGTLTMNLANGYTGGTTITGGVLTSTAAGSLGTGLITLSNGILNANTATALGTAPVTVTGGTLNATVTNALGAGNIALNGGTLIPANVATPFGTATVAFGGGTLQYLATGTTTDISANLKNSLSSMRIDTNGNTATFSAALPATNTGGLNKLGTGTLILSGANVYTGGTTITDGTLQANSVAALTGAVAVQSTGTLSLFTAGLTYANTLTGNGTVSIPLGTGSTTTTLSGNLSGFTGAYSTSAGGKLTITSTGSNLPAAGATIRVNTTGTLFQSSGATIPSAIQLYGGTTGEAIGQLRVENNSTISGAVTLFANSTVGNNTAGNTGFISGNIGENGGSFGLTKQAAGAIVLAGANTYTGTTTVTTGTLRLSGSHAGSGAFAVGTGTTFDVTSTGSIMGAAPINASGTGLVILSGSATASTITLAAGTTLQGEGSAAALVTSGAANLNIDPTTSGAFTASGALTLGGTLSIGFVGPVTGPSAIKVLNFGTTAATAASFALASPGNYRGGATATFTVNAGEVTLNGLSKKSLEWNLAATAGTWNINSTANFRDTTTTAAETFFTGDDVLFGNLPGVSAATITITGTVIPSSFNVNSSASYTFTGGSIGGTTSIVKSGAGALSLGQANTFTGGITLSQGSLTLVTSAAAGGTGAITIGDVNTGVNNLTLSANLASGNFANPITVTNNGTGLVTIAQGATLSTLSGTLTLNRPTIIAMNTTDRTGISGKITGNVGTLTFTGTRTTLDNIVPNDFVGDVVIASGALQPNVVNALPSTASVTINGAAILQLNNGFSQSINALNGGTAGTTGVQIIAGTAATLTIGSNNGSGIFNGNIINNAAAISLTKTGTGAQVLNGTLTYTGTTAVNQGTLQLPSGSTLAGAVTVANGATLAVGGQAGSTLTTNSLTLGTSAATTLAINNLSPTPSGVPLRVNTAMAANGPVTLNVDLSRISANGTYSLIAYPTSGIGGSGFGAFTLGAMPSGFVATLNNNTSTNTIELVVTSVGSTLWVGNNGPAWDVNSTENWLVGAAASKYFNGDKVVFDDSATTFVPSLGATVTPASVAFTNATTDYTLSGAGGIGGVTPITKSGNAKATLTTANFTTGLTSVTGGTLQLGDATANGSVGGNILNTANLIFANATAQTYAGVISGGASGLLTKTGVGTLTLTGANTTGNIVVSQGTLQIGDRSVTSLGSIPSTSQISIASGATMAWNLYNGATVANSITGTGTILLQGANSATLAATSYGALSAITGFNGTLAVNRARLGAITTAAQFGNSGVGIDVQFGGQLFFNSAVNYPNNITIQDGAGWYDGASFHLGALRVGASVTLSGNIILNNTTSTVIDGDTSGANSVLCTWEASSPTLSGVISGPGELSMSVRTGGAGTGNISLTGTASNTYAGKTVINGVNTTNAANMRLMKTNSPTANTALSIPGGIVQMGNKTLGQANLLIGDTASTGALRSQWDNQFGSGVVMNFVNPLAPNFIRFSLQGSNQTLAGVNAGNATTSAAAVIQNRSALLDPIQNATLTLNGSDSYIYNGIFRDQDNLLFDRKLNLIKSGSGTQTFVGANITHTGTNVISGGTLVFPARATAYGDTTVSNTDTKLGITGTSGTVFSVPNLTFGSGTKLSIGNFGSLTGTNKCIDVTGTLATSGPVTVDISALPAGGGPFPIIKYANSYVGTDFVLDVSGWTLPRSISSPMLVNDTVNKVINLTATYTPLVWVGTSNIWDLTTQNWTIAGSPADYDEGDVVQFDESGTATNPNVVLNTVVSPSVVNFMNTTNPYSLAGTGGIGGTAAINKSGAGTVVIRNANPTTGITTINDGVLRLGDATANGSLGGSASLIKGTLQLGDGTANGSVGGNIALAGATAPDATLVLNPATSQTLANIISGSATQGTVSKIGTGTTILTGVNTYLGATNITGGTLQLGNGTIQPTIPSTYAITSPGTLKIQYNTAVGAVAQTWTKYTGNGTLSLATGKNFDTGWGNGTLANTFTGTLRIEGGRVALAAATGAGTNFGLGGTTKVIITSGGHVGMWESISLPNTMAFEIAGTGYGEANFEEAIRMGNGSTTSTINGPVLLTASAAVGAQGAGTGIIAGVISGGVGANLTIGALTGTQQTGTISLSGANTYAGDTIINMGTLRLGAAGVIPDGVGKGNVTIAVVSSTATFSLNSFSETINGLSGSGIITAGSGTPTLTVGGNDQTSLYSGTIDNIGTLALNKIGTGTLTLSGPLAGSPAVPTSNSTFTGNITVSSGRLIGAAVRTGSTGTVFGAPSNTRTITVESGAFLEFHATNTFGGHNTVAVPTLVVNGGTVTNADPLVTNRINNGLRNVTLNGGSLLATVGNGTSDIDAVNRPGEGYGAWGFNGIVTSTGISLISTGSLTGKAGRILLSSNTADTNFNVTSGTLTVAAPLQTGESTPSYGMTKTGSGTLVLSAVNVHSTPTLISAGTLHLTGSMVKPSPLIAASAITVGSSGTLTGTGTAEGTVTVQSGGFVNPGTAGTVGTLNVGASTLAGTYTCDINGANADRINVTGALTASGTPSLVFNTVAAPTAASYTIATYTTGSAPVIPTITGVPAGYVIDTATVGEIKLVSLYLTWASGKGLTGGNNGLAMDPDNDNITNLQEYYFDGNPLANDPSILPQSSLDATYLKLTFKRRDDAESDVISQIAQWGSNLTGWTPATITAATAAADANGVIITVGENGTAADDVEVKIPRSNAVNGVLFGRVLITE